MNKEEYIFNFLLSNGCTYAGAIGILANLKAENSQFEPTRVETSYLQKLKNLYGINSGEEYAAAIDNGTYTNFKDGIGFGLAQWTYYTRKQNLYNYSKSRGLSIGDFNLLLDFLVKEMLVSYSNCWKVVSSTDNYEYAATVVCELYEKPAKVEELIVKRKQYAREYNELFKNYMVIAGIVEEKNMINAREAVINLALSQVGYKEKKTPEYLDDFIANAGTNNYTKYARDLDAIDGFYNGKKLGLAWCDMFVDWCFVELFGVDKALELLCLKKGGSGAGCTYSMGYFRAKGLFVKRSEGLPQPGDLIFFGTGLDNSYHTGLVVKVEDNIIYTVEGNTNTNGSNDGDGVYLKLYSPNKSSIIGYGRPNWSLVEDYTVEKIEKNVEEVKETAEEDDTQVTIEEKKIDVQLNNTFGVYSRKRLIDIAMAEVGYLEKKSEKDLDNPTGNYGENDFTKYARDLDAIEDYYYHDRKLGLSWCDIFCDWCFVTAFGFEDSLKVNCQPKKSYGAGCDMSAKYYRDAGRLDNKPRVGDQFFINSYTHTGLVIEVRNHSVVTIEGNLYNSDGKLAVCLKVRLLEEIDGFGHPNYNDGLEGKFYWNEARTDLIYTGADLILEEIVEEKIEELKVEESTVEVIEEVVKEKEETLEAKEDIAREVVEIIDNNKEKYNLEELELSKETIRLVLEYLLKLFKS